VQQELSAPQQVAEQLAQAQQVAKQKRSAML
jgi:hypothetical protein